MNKDEVIDRDTCLENDMNILIYNQKKLGNYKLSYIQDFINYYMMYSFAYILYGRVVKCFKTKDDFATLLKTFRGKLSLKFLDINEYIKQLCISQDISIFKGTKQRFIYNIIDNFGKKAKKPLIMEVNRINEARIEINFNSEMENFIERIYKNVVITNKSPQNISEFYKYYMSTSNPMKHFTKPYLIDIDVMKKNTSEIKKFINNNKKKNSMNTYVNLNYWEEMVLKSCYLSIKNDKTDYLPSLKHQNFLIKFNNFLEKVSDQSKYTTEIDVLRIIQAIVKATISHKYRILFIKGLNKLVPFNSDLWSDWERIKQEMNEKFYLSIYSIH